MGTLRTASLFMSELGRAAHLRRQLTQEEGAEIAFAWQRMSNGGPTVSPRQLKIALRAFGFQVKSADVAALLTQLPVSARGALDQAAFTELLTGKLQERDPEEERRHAFGLFDLRGGGKITAQDLAAIAAQLQCDIDPSEIKDMIDEFDQDGDGAINEQEFAAIMAAALAEPPHTKPAAGPLGP